MPHIVANTLAPKAVAGLRRPLASRAAALSYSGKVFPAPRPATLLRAVIDGGAGVIDKVDSDTVKEKDSRTSKRHSPIYKVLLHNDDVNRRDYVVKVLMKVVHELTMDDAVMVMEEAHLSGVALVTACAQETAEEYCEGLRGNGLISTIEPDSGSGGSWGGGPDDN
ncbi:unnamed protein product [Pedinophyceae sp. YPF-701]|nr:unnamed protein product [Pedinophyceae sp. YPF-701]